MVRRKTVKTFWASIHQSYIDEYSGCIKSSFIDVYDIYSRQYFDDSAEIALRSDNPKSLGKVTHSGGCLF